MGRELPRTNKLIGHLGRHIAAENPLDAGSLCLGGSMRPDHVARAVDGQRRDGRYQGDLYPLAHANRDGEEVRIKKDGEEGFARR